MPEGDTVFQAGHRLRQALAGHTLTRGELRHPRLSTIDLAGRTVQGVRTVGKHIFVQFSGDVSLHNHLRMDGSWHVHRPGTRWRAPGHQVRVILAHPSAEAIGVRLHDMELVATDKESRLVGHLGPDLLDPSWTDEDAERAQRALAADPAREIGVALLDQRVMAGVGNVYKAEVCFLLGVSPWTPVSGVDTARAVELSRDLLRRNAMNPRRNTTGSTMRGRELWVYEQTRRGCLKCGGRIRVADQGAGLDVRKTWYCPVCQPRT
ncbi:DNA-formamidopyrimidine glycosylase family protein [Kibdelosporangium phytohabitans]|uniref:DNA-(apurinic or apyrimidinic site) lyase n=1 Tax=Kibdelosporangium phytohabitans TaxID=860235 RepID=A0A0N9I2K7_9PSEU|nr:DNA-formamidopyrimidine glycosylase family protein [Kibdelosporangium phytohabitans]ALG12869.1 DNA glycosylase [Kibdelosporangium phytohabitans]MBE1464568.1 endonuclease-8 [Kibdelosporangium phytohabitans]